MRHRKHHRKLNRTAEHRLALRRNMAQNLFEHGSITTTLPKAKDLRPFAERLITLAVKTRAYARSHPAASLRARRAIERLMGDRAVIPQDKQDEYDAMSDAMRSKTLRMVSGRRHRTGEPKGRLGFTADSVARRLIEGIAPRFEGRSGGYTRVIRLSDVRLGDAAPKAILQLVGEEEAPGPVTKPEKTARRRRVDARYAFAIKLSKSRASRPKSAEKKPAGDHSDSDEVKEDGAGDDQ